MIIISIISLLISFLLEGLTTNLFSYTLNNISIFTTMYVIINLIVLKQYYESEKKYLIIAVIFCLLLDIVYSNTLLLTTCIFIVIYYINKILTSILPYNYLTINILSILSIIIYHIVTFLFLIIFRYDSFGVMVLLKVIYSNIIMTFIYTSILYYIISTINKKLSLKVVRD